MLDGLDRQVDRLRIASEGELTIGGAGAVRVPEQPRFEAAEVIGRRPVPQDGGVYVPLPSESPGTGSSRFEVLP
jgi:hypothetical protein